MTCKIDIKRIDFFFLNAFYVSKCFLNLINFNQLNDFCSMTYKSKMLFIENQNIITRKRVNNTPRNESSSIRIDWIDFCFWNRFESTRKSRIQLIDNSIQIDFNSTKLSWTRRISKFKIKKLKFFLSLNYLELTI